MKLLIPTRNRPESLLGVLTFVETFYPSASVIVADGSSDESKPLVESAVNSIRTLKVDFRSYPYEQPYYDRVLDVLENEHEEFMVMGADDDYPLLDTLSPGEAFLRQNTDYALAIGTLLIIELNANGEMTARARPVRPISSDAALDRVQHYASWPFPLSYALCRRSALISRYRKTRDCPMGEMFDLQAGTYDCLEGKVHALEGVSVILTRNTSHTYLRAASKLDFFENGPQISKVIRDFSKDLEIAAGIEPEEALRVATKVFSRHVGAYLTGIPYQRHPQFRASDFWRNSRIRGQYDLFRRLFEAGTQERRDYESRLLYISAALRRAADSTYKTAQTAAK